MKMIKYAAKSEKKDERDEIPGETAEAAREHDT